MKLSLTQLLLALAWLACATPTTQADRKPNVVLIMTDDQGYGDLACHGNPVIRTPNIDRLASEGVELSDFHVSPVCAPTRASLLTGRYNHRTRAVDTYRGRAMMDPAEVTLAEMLRAAGYKTGIFGKWHLGDCYPMRPQDQGFDETLVLRGGGIGQPSDPPEGTSYFDPLLRENGTWKKHKGYCSDVFTDAAMSFVEKNHDKPFFLYLPFNAPHTPLQVPQAALDRYSGLDLSIARFGKVGQPFAQGYNAEVTAKVYAMVENIDHNIGRLLGKLDALELRKDTIVVFLTDNGPQQARFNAGMRGRKGQVYEGGIRVPCFISWPDRIPKSTKCPIISAHIDLTPTILDACQIAKLGDVSFDGMSLMRSLMGETADQARRMLFHQWHRGDAPQKLRACAVRDGNWKLVFPRGVAENDAVHFPEPELYDLSKDPYETNNIASQSAEVVSRLVKAHLSWHEEVSATRGYDPPRIVIGSPAEPVTTLTRQDWRGPQAEWNATGLGYWEVSFEKGGNYKIDARFAPLKAPTKLSIRANGKLVRAIELPAGEKGAALQGLRFENGPSRLLFELSSRDGVVGVHQADVAREP